MKATTKAIIAGVVAIAASVGLIVWQTKVGHASSNSLSAEEMALIAEGSAPQERMQLASSPEARKAFAEDYRGLLALSAEARAKGYADRPEVKRQLERQRMLVIAQSFVLAKRDEGVPPSQLYSKEEVEALLQEPASQQQFEQYIQDYQALGLAPQGEIPEAQKKAEQQRWGTVQVVARKALAAGVEKERKTQLQIRMQQARVLAGLYQRDLIKTLEPSDEEVEKFLAEHPEADPKAARAKAEDVLRRVRAGEDFAALAREFSDDPGSKEQGGEIGWVERNGMYDPDFTEAAFKLKNGEVSDIVETQFGLHIIKVDERRTEKGEDGKPQEQVHVSHILIRPEIKGSEELPPGLPPREAVRAAILMEKHKKLVDEVAGRYHVKVAEEFAVTQPELKMPPGMMSPHGGAPGPQPQGGAPAGPGGGGAEGAGQRPRQ